MSDQELLPDLNPPDFSRPNVPLSVITSQGPQMDKHKRFLDLPGEIRDKIYDLVIPTGTQLTVTGTSLDRLQVGVTDAPMKKYRVRRQRFSRPQPYSFPKALLHLNKMIHWEVCSYVYGEQTFAFDSNPPFTAFLCKISNSDPSLDPIRCLKNVSLNRFSENGSYRMAEFLTGEHYRKRPASRPVYALEKIYLTNIRDAPRHIISMRAAIANISACEPEWDIFDIVIYPDSSACTMADCQTSCGLCREYFECRARIADMLCEITNEPSLSWRSEKAT